MDKKLSFEYVLYKLVEWYKESYGLQTDADFNRSNDLSKLKIIKLHFFVSSVNAKDNSLLSVFNKFCAMPYGHVESDIYNDIPNLTRFSVSARTLVINKEHLDLLNSSFGEINQTTKDDIDSAIAMLKIENIELIRLSALDLVDISHFHFSWKYTFNQARSIGVYSKPIPPLLIKDEIKYFALN